MVDIVFTSRRPLIFNAEDACRLRQDHRIVGSLVGCLPRAPRQNGQLGLPLQLLNEEAELLREKGLARLVQNQVGRQDDDEASTSRRQAQAVEFNKMRDDQYWKQNELYKEDRRKKIEQYAEAIVKGKRKKMKKTILSDVDAKAETAVVDGDELLQIELRKIDSLVMPRDTAKVQLFTECPWQDKDKVQAAAWNFPQTDGERLRYAVFKHLWEKGYFLTAGAKFGGHFLVYPGDPMRFHASHVAICLGANDTLTGHDIIAKGRLGTMVKKTILLCSLDGDKVSYLSLRWSKYPRKNQYSL